MHQFKLLNNDNDDDDDIARHRFSSVHPYVGTQMQALKSLVYFKTLPSPCDLAVWTTGQISHD